MEGILEKSAVCPHFRVCGGCTFQDVPYDVQRERKRAEVAALLEPLQPDAPVEPVVPSPVVWHYRNKMEFAVGSGREGIVAGLRRKNAFQRIVNLTECRIFHPDTGALLDAVRAWVAAAGWEPYDMVRRTGTVRYVAMRHAKATGALMVELVVTGSSATLDAGRRVLEDFADRVQSVAPVRSVYVCINNKQSDNALTDDLSLIRGDDCIVETVNGVRCEVRPQTFLQTNTACCEVLYRTVCELVGDGDVLDLYCGSGGITLQLARPGRKVIGVDSVPANIAAARANAVLNGSVGCEFVAAPAEEFIHRLGHSQFANGMETIVVDPPRAGLSKRVRAAVAEAGVGRIVYVSCNPESLAGDLQTFMRFYRITRIVPVDMFPHTRHVETIAVLEHR
jgi:23S rRNA (uracil-5-)-methyltransferase RumA